MEYIVVLVVLCVAVIAISMTFSIPKKRIVSYRVASAAYPDGNTAQIEAYDISNRKIKCGTKLLKPSEHETFIVQGRSMSPWSVNSGDILLVTKLKNEEYLRLTKKDVILYNVDPQRHSYEHPETEGNETKIGGFKVRKFLTVIDLSREVDALCNELQELVSEVTKAADIKIVCEKIKKAKGFYANTATTIAIVSLSFKQGRIDYSIHSISDLYGKVECILPEKHTTIAA